MAPHTSSGHAAPLSGDCPLPSTFLQSASPAFEDRVSRFRETLQSAGLEIVRETILEDRADFIWRYADADPELEPVCSTLVRKGSIEADEDDDDMIPVLLDGPALEALAARNSGQVE